MPVATRWFLIGLAGWTAFAGLVSAWGYVEHEYEGVQIAWLPYLGVNLVQIYILGLFTPALLLVARAFPPTRRPTVLTLGAYFAALLAICAFAELLVVVVSNTFLGKHYTFKMALGGGFEDFLAYMVALALIATAAIPAKPSWSNRARTAVGQGMTVDLGQAPQNLQREIWEATSHGSNRYRRFFLQSARS